MTEFPLCHRECSLGASFGCLSIATTNMVHAGPAFTVSEYHHIPESLNGIHNPLYILIIHSAVGPHSTVGFGYTLPHWTRKFCREEKRLNRGLCGAESGEPPASVTLNVTVHVQQNQNPQTKKSSKTKYTFVCV